MFSNTNNATSVTPNTQTQAVRLGIATLKELDELNKRPTKPTILTGVNGYKRLALPKHMSLLCLDETTQAMVEFCNRFRNTLQTTIEYKISDKEGNKHIPLPVLADSDPSNAVNIPFTPYYRIQTERAIAYARKQHYNSKAPKVLRLNTHTLCTCPETGIQFSVALPSPLSSNMPLLHPLWTFSNCEAYIKAYQRIGEPIAKFDAQVLAGLLITILRHKGFSVCRDAFAANKRLRLVNKKTLTQAISYFMRSQKRDKQPQFNLLADCEPTEQLLGFMSICKGEDESITVHHMLVEKTHTIKARVYSTDQEKEYAQVRTDIKDCLHVLSCIAKDKSIDISEQAVKAFEYRIKALATMSDNAKQKLADDITSVCSEDNQYNKAIRLLIFSTSTNALQKDLLSFSQELDSELTEWKAGKVDFMALLKQVKKDTQ